VDAFLIWSRRKLSGSIYHLYPKQDAPLSKEIIAEDDTSWLCV
jgi:hypothetical protein